MHRLPNRVVLRLSGPDTLALLERTVTQGVADWAAGDIRFGALLTPQGKVLADYLATRTGDGVLLDVHEDAADNLMKQLRLFRLRLAVEIARADELAVIASETGAPDPRSSGLPKRLIRPAAEVAAKADAAHYHALRIALGVPEWGADYRAQDVFPTDVNIDLMGGIDYHKGCFVGQEVASRMKRRGRIRKRTVLVEGDDLEPGAEIIGDGVIGEITSVDDSGQTALARIRLDRYAASLERLSALSCNGAPIALRVGGPIAAEVSGLRDADEE